MRSILFPFFGILFILFGCNSKEGTTPPGTVPDEGPVIITNDMIFGLPKDSFHIATGVIEPNEFLSNILVEYDVTPYMIQEIAQKAEDVFSVRQLRAGKPYTILRKDTSSPASWFIYEPNDRTYVCYNLDSLHVQMHTRQIDTTVNMASGTINSSLWAALQNQGLSPGLISKMENAFEWTISFNRIQPGDKFKLIYEDLCVEGCAGGVGRILGAYFEASNKPYYAIWYDSEKYSGYFDQDARPMKKNFLRDPVKFSRISSRYALKRFHPRLKYYRPHFGTDYAAPMNTPIRSVADGVVTEARYKGGNGNYVKIRHDDVYETQYLHMNKFQNGVRAGSRVKQGDIIGYVGKTGLATGPHVCFRFWKNGKQIDHLRENLPPPEPMHESELPNYFKVRDLIVGQLDEIEFEPVPAPIQKDTVQLRPAISLLEE